MDANRGQRMASGPLKLEFEAAVSHLTQVGGTKPSPLEQHAFILNCHFPLNIIKYFV